MKTQNLKAPTPTLQGAPADEAEGKSALQESLIEGSVAWQGRFLDVRLDRVRLPDGSEAQREYIVHPGAVMVVPVLDDQHVIMEHQYRYPMGRVMLEFPAGKLDDGEHPLACAKRELQEETGYRATQWARAGVLHNAIAYSTEGIEFWFARGLTLGSRNLDAGEFLEVCTISDAELEVGVRDGRITDAKTMIGLLYLQHWRAGRWTLDWSAG